MWHDWSRVFGGGVALRRGLVIYFMLNQEDNGPKEPQAGMTDER